MSRGGPMLLLALSLGCPPDSPGDTDTDADTDADADTDDTDTETGWDLETRPSNPSCLAMDRPATDASVELVPAYPNLEFDLPLGLIQAPNDPSTWYVIEQRGRLIRFDDDDATT